MLWNPGLRKRVFVECQTRHSTLETDCVMNLSLLIGAHDFGLNGNEGWMCSMLLNCRKCGPWAVAWVFDGGGLYRQGGEQVTQVKLVLIFFLPCRNFCKLRLMKENERRKRELKREEKQQGSYSGIKNYCRNKSLKVDEGQSWQVMVLENAGKENMQRVQAPISAIWFYC